MHPPELLGRFLLSKEAAGCTRLTLHWYRMCIARYLDWCGESGEYKKPDTIEAYIAGLRQSKLASSTVSGYYTALAAWFKWLHQRDLIDDYPLRHLPKPKQIRKVKRHVAKSDFQRLYDSISVRKWHDQRDKCLLLVLYYSGLRMNETLNLYPTDVDLDSRIITVRRGKGDKARPVPCHPLLLDELPLYLEMRPPFGSDYLFVADDGHGRIRGRLSEAGLRSLLMRRFAQAKVAYCNPHAFRHAFAIHFLNSGMEMSAVAAAMGHASVKTTESEYAYWLTSGLKREYDEALRRMESAVT